MGKKKRTIPKTEQLYFNASHLQAAHGEYVLWLDGMGTGTSLETSLSHAANFIFKLHRAVGIAVAGNADVHIYPLMDGMYVTSPKRNAIEAIIRKSMILLAHEFVSKKKITEHFLVRGAIAYGATLHGEEIPENCFIKTERPAPGPKAPKKKSVTADERKFRKSKLNETRSRLLLSSAMSAAYGAERLAAPFGIFVHNTAISVPRLVDPTDNGFPSQLWYWWVKNGEDDAKKAARVLVPAVCQYFREAECRSLELGYPRASISRHKEAFIEYFASCLTTTSEEPTDS